MLPLIAESASTKMILGRSRKLVGCALTVTVDYIQLCYPPGAGMRKKQHKTVIHDPLANNGKRGESTSLGKALQKKKPREKEPVVATVRPDQRDD